MKMVACEKWFPVLDHLILDLGNAEQSLERGTNVSFTTIPSAKNIQGK